MRLILLGTDRALFTAGSAVRERITRLGGGVTALDSIVFSTRKHGITVSQELSLNVHAHPTNSQSRLLYIFDALRVAKKLSRPDVVSAQDPFETGLAALLIARYWNVPLAIEVHTDFLAPTFVRHSLLNRLRVCIAGYVLRRAAGGYAVSAEVARRVHERYPEAPLFKVLPIFVDTNRFAAINHVPHTHFKTSLLWVGRMEKEKNPELALDSFIGARKKGFDIGLTFVGSGSLSESLKKKMQSEGVTDRVEFIGMVTDPSSFYATADLLLVTSDYEGYGMALVEALAAGVPVLSTDVGIAREAGAIITGGDYTTALLAWLESSRERGVLKLHPYTNEEEYFEAIRGFYASLIH